MKWRVLISAPYMLPVLNEFEPYLRENDVEPVPAKVNERLEESDLLPLLQDIDAVICGDDRFTETVLKAAPRLKVISKWGTGIDSIDRQAAQRLGIRVCNTPDAFTEPVADTVLGYILAFARRLPWMDADMRAGKWKKIPLISLRECVLGVIGVGNVGKGVTRRAAAFGMRILGNDVVEIPAIFRDATGLEAVSKEHLLMQADFISLNCDLNPTSYHIIGDRELRLMKGNAYLINTARGPLIDEAALIAALKAGRIAGAALDVFEKEPLPLDSPLREFANCMFAPHNANSSPAVWKRVHENTIHNLLAGLREALR